MRILRAADHRRMPWKNGGGVTTEIVVHPENAGLDGFEWRLSMALVAQDGPFSLFPGIDRVLAMLEGEGLSLSIDGAAPELLAPTSPPLAFAGDVPVHGALAGGPVTDLNLMVRRGTPHAMRRVVPGPGEELVLRARWNLLFNPAGRVEIAAGTLRADLGPQDALLIENAETVAFGPAPSPHLFLIEIG